MPHGPDTSVRTDQTNYRSIVEHASEAIVVTQGETVRYCNPRVCELSGYSQEQILARNFLEFIHPEEQGKVLREYRERVAGEHPTSTYTTRIITKGGQEKQMLVNSALIEWEGPTTRPRSCR